MIRYALALGFALLSTSALAENAPAKAPVAAPAQAPVAKEAAPAHVEVNHEFTYVPKAIDIVYGEEKAPITLVEYASLSCPHCAAFYRDVFPELKKKYIDTGKVRLVYRDYPLNTPALEAAQLVHCADPAARPTYIKVLYSTQDKWAYDVNYHQSLGGIAVLGGMERQKFEDCTKDKETQNAIVLAYQEANDKFKVKSTPTLFINNQVFKGTHTFAALSKDLDEALDEAPKAPTPKTKK